MGKFSTITSAIALFVFVTGCRAPDPSSEDGDTGPSAGSSDGGAGSSETRLAQDESSDEGQEADSGEEGASGSTSGAGSDCEEFRGAVSADQVALTPRENLAAERLAIQLTSEPVVPDDVYARAVDDLGVLEGMGFVGCAYGASDPTRILLTFSEHYDEAIAGAYEPWACANERYGAFLGPVDVRPENGTGSPVVLGLGGIFDTVLVTTDYLGLPGVDAVETIPITCQGDLGGAGPISAMYACAERSTWHYWWTDAYEGQPGHEITEGAHLVSEVREAPAVACSWSAGERACDPPACLGR